MSYLAPVCIVGGQGGKAFDIDYTRDGGTLKRIRVYCGKWQIRGIHVWFTNGRFCYFGRPFGGFLEFKFEDGEHFTSLSLQENRAGTRLGAIKFKTNRSREFFVHMTDWGLRTEYPVDVGSGICMGITGRSGEDIDCLGFKFINTITSTKLTNVQYPTLHNVKPNVAVEKIKSTTYQNNTGEPQEYKLETSKTITRMSSWSVTNKLGYTFNMEVKAGVPEVVEVSTGFSFTVGTESSYGLHNTEEKTELFSFPVMVPPGKAVDVDVTIGRATIDLPYTGTVRITCCNGSVLEFPTSGTYKGVTYTDAKIIMNESAKSLEKET